jgi:hypothetical protein
MSGLFCGPKTSRLKPLLQLTQSVGAGRAGTPISREAFDFAISTAQPIARRKKTPHKGGVLLKLKPIT